MWSKSVSLVLLCCAVFGCSSAPRGNNSETEPDRVIARMDELTSRPDWLKEAEPFRVENGLLFSLGQTTIPGDNRVEAAYRIAENNAKRNIATTIEQRLNFVFQNAEEGTGMDSTQARYIGGEVSNITTSSIRPGKYYWEKVATTHDSGQRATVYKVYATVTMPEEDFKRAVMDAARRRQGKGGLSQDFAKKVDTHWDKLVGEGGSKAEQQ